ncbi:uncharacterized protein Z520_01133 [Fonsecaea multimorphosa CBS 102226]|uniref:SnoaL-like domain-containing protein n=1 Tax=Fonsecaea multimorphosa CBS 102226 TaxID=1442371 RepID=A0A0D2K9C9_9EURO|nr:uncharacterized protein Z520_01133 [Fonsecaea multimorphosa CBS 102226]KIY02668.1 hypothetical protein Z520_01133 [Fonsecaea multimorphosa CBS 102226]OAL31529.1 hypothetical protein AYO22_01121 [Fonsecaea multimorphosa]
MAPPTTSQISRLFTPLSIQGRQPETLALLADDVDWTISGHSPMSARYTSKQDFIDNTLKVLRERVLTEPLRLGVRHVIVSPVGEEGKEGKDEEIEGEVVVELEALDAVCRNGLPYDMRYCWICKFARGKIVQVRAYLDTDLLTRAIQQNP